MKRPPKTSWTIENSDQALILICALFQACSTLGKDDPKVHRNFSILLICSLLMLKKKGRSYQEEGKPSLVVLEGPKQIWIASHD